MRVTRLARGTRIAALLLLALLAPAAVSAAPLTGAIFTTDAACVGTNVNLFTDKDDVHLGGGPEHSKAAGLPDGSYYVRVTEPGGTLLGSSLLTSDPTPVTVVSGEFIVCYQLSAILGRASDGSPGYDDTSNSGGEYKVWVSTTSDFNPSGVKTDNFKVKKDGPQPARLQVVKFYDANANGLNDDGISITGWRVRIVDNIDYVRFTPVDILVDPDDYVVTESSPIEANWLPTTPNPVSITLGGGNTTVGFGNVCLGAGGGLTLGYWSNKNGAAQFGGDDRDLMVSLHLRNADGSHFDPANHAAFRKWILSATAANMANMLSAQLAAMALSVHNGHVNPNALVHAPGATSANAAGFATVTALISEANSSLGTNGFTVAAGATRTYQEALKNALDNANNNQTFARAQPCPFSFADIV